MALAVGVLRIQVGRVEVQVPGEGNGVRNSLPAEAGAAATVDAAETVVVIAAMNKI